MNHLVFCLSEQLGVAPWTDESHTGARCFFVIFFCFQIIGGKFVHAQIFEDYVAAFYLALVCDRHARGRTIANRERESGALALLRLDPNIAAEFGANVLDDGQAHSDAAAILLMLGTVTLREVTEEAVKHMSADARARVDDLGH